MSTAASASARLSSRPALNVLTSLMLYLVSVGDRAGHGDGALGFRAQVRRHLLQVCCRLFNAGVEFRVLGPVEVIEAGRPLQLGSRKQRAVLALLLLHAGEVVPRERLIEELWHARPPPTADATLRSYLSRLRSVLGAARIRTRSPGHMLVAKPEELDAKTFERLLAAGRVALAEERAVEAARLFADALGLWRGDPFADFVYEPFAQTEIARLSELRLEALEERIAAELRLGLDEALVAELRELVSEHPVREGLCCQLMLALYRCGRQAEALGVYASARRVLIDELGLEPGPELRALERAILRQDESLVLPRELERAARDVRKNVTVVAVLASRNVGDPEAKRLLAERVMELSAPTVARNGGWLTRHFGAELVVIFGVPEVHEDDALRAGRVACDLREDLAEVSELNVGISSGEVVVSGLEVSGEPVEAAVSLAAQAAGNEILLDDETRELAGVAAEVAPAGEGWCLVGVRPATRPLALTLDTPFIGRREPLEQLRRTFLDVVASRSCRLTTVLGEPGVGKSRLAREFARLLHAEASVVIGSCPSFGEGITLWPLRQLVGQLVGEVTRDRVRRLLANEPDAELVASRLEAALGSSTTEASIEELFRAARRLLKNAGSRGPLLVILEDLHWAEARFLDLIEDIASVKAPLFLLCVARPEIFKRQARWGEGGETIELGALDSREAARLLEAIGLHLPHSTRERILEAAQGNPLFLEQFAAAAAASTQGEPTLPLPPTIRAVLATRLERLGPGERALLECGAIIGKDFPMAGAIELLPPDARPVAERHRDALINGGFLRVRLLSGSTADDSEFRHALIQDACYSSIPKLVRAELHERFARWQDASTADRSGEHAAIIGHHLEQAARYKQELGQPDPRLSTQAAEQLAIAGRRALGRQDFAAARKLLERASAVRSEGGVDVPLEIDLAEALYFSGSAELAYRSLESVAERAATAADRIGELCARIQEGILRFQVEPGGGLERLRALTEQALPLFDTAGDDFALSLVHFARGEIGHHQNRWDTELAEQERAQFHARRTGLPHLVARGIPSLVVARFYGSTPLSKLLVWLDKQEASGVRHLDFKGWRAAAFASLGRLDEARALDAETRREHAERGATLMLGAWASQESARIELLAGDPAAAVALAEEGCRLLEQAGARSLLSTGACYLASALYALERLDEAQAWATEGAELGGSDDVVTQILSRRVRGKVLARTGQHNEGEVLAREAVAIAETTEAPIHQADAYADLAEVLECTGRRTEATAALQQALERYERKEALVPARYIHKRLTTLQPS
jgi:DNA-binding SARP family transcriptional activator